MAKQSNRKAARVLLAAGAPLVVAVAGVNPGPGGRPGPGRQRPVGHSRSGVLGQRDEL